ncbi:MAG TPA: T9SS type B sorting domain-containing protein [Chitinophagales bacterium]|nr:T9SS type B sorting domain-containing protein [Chitinophagales bacterium]
MKNLFLASFLSFIAFFVSAQTQINLSPSTSVICSTGHDTLFYNVSASGLPPNTNVVIYQSRDSTFNPYLQQGDSIGYIPGNALPVDTINFGSCIKTLGIFIDACGATGQEPKNEYMVLTSGSGIRVTNLAINFDPANSNSGNNNDNDINLGTNPCGFKTPDAALIANLQVGSCNAANIIPVSPTDSIPPNAIILCFTSDSVNTIYNVNGLCNLGYPIYVVQSSCTRTIGAFTNAPSCSSTATTRYRKTIAIDTRQNCQDNFVYDRCGIFNLDGTYAIRQQGTDTARVSNNGIRRNTVDSCGGIDYTKLIFNSDTLLKLPLSTNLCNAGKYFIKAITHPEGTQPISNTISYELKCVDVNTNTTRQEFCSGNTTNIQIDGTDPNATYSWTVSGGAGISGATNGTGTSIQQTLTYTGTSKDSLTYTITASDGNCTKSTQVNVVVKNCDTCNLGFQINGNTSICNGQSTILSVAVQADSLRWNTGASSNSITVSQAGTYSVTVYKNGCSKTEAVTVNVNQLSVAISGNRTFCSGQSTTLVAEGAYDSLRWSNGISTTFNTISQPGTYTVVAYQNGCLASTAVTVSVQQVDVNITGDTILCNGESTTISIAGQFDSVRWSTGETTNSIIISSAGTYSVLGYLNGCSGVDIVTVESSNLSVNITGTDVICGGTTATLTAIGVYDSLRWNTNETSASINVTESGRYSVTAFLGACSISASFYVARVSIDYFLPKKVDSICQGDTARFILFAGDLGAAPVDTFYFTQPGRYLVSYTTTICGVFYDSVFVYEKHIQKPNITGNLQICGQQTTTLDAGLGYETYQWLPNSETTQTITTANTGTYIVTGFKGRCFASDTVVVQSAPLPPSFHLGNDTTYCNNFSRTLSTGDATTVWSTGATAATITVTGAGTYVATITNACGFTSDTIIIKLANSPILNLGNDTTICNSNLILHAPMNMESYLWSTQETTSSITVNTDGTYWVVVTDSNHCQAVDSISIGNNCMHDVWIPTAFSPNGDGINDVFMVRSSGNFITVKKMLIYDRWGQLLFSAYDVLANDVSKGWDGTYKGKIAQLESYGFVIETEDTSVGMKKTFKGNVTIIR